MQPDRIDNFNVSVREKIKQGDHVNNRLTFPRSFPTEKAAAEATREVRTASFILIVSDLFKRESRLMRIEALNNIQDVTKD